MSVGSYSTTLWPGATRRCGLVPAHDDRAVGRHGLDRRRPGRAVGAALHEHVAGDRAVDPGARPRRADAVGPAGRRPSPTDHACRGDVDVDDVARPARRPAARRPCAGRRSPARRRRPAPSRRPSVSTTVAGCSGRCGAEEAVAGRRVDVMKHTSWLSGLAAVRSPSAAAPPAHLVLGQVADREQRRGPAAPGRACART